MPELNTFVVPLDDSSALDDIQGFENLSILFPQSITEDDAKRVEAILKFWARDSMRVTENVHVEQTGENCVTAFFSSDNSQVYNVWQYQPFDSLRTYLYEGTAPLRFNTGAEGRVTHPPLQAPTVSPVFVVLDTDAVAQRNDRVAEGTVKTPSLSDIVGKPLVDEQEEISEGTGVFAPVDTNHILNGTPWRRADDFSSLSERDEVVSPRQTVVSPGATDSGAGVYTVDFWAETSTSARSEKDERFVHLLRFLRGKISEEDIETALYLARAATR